MKLDGMNVLESLREVENSDESCSDDSEVSSSDVNAQNELDRVRKFASEETFRVRSMRMLSFLTLLGTGTIVCVLVYAVLLFQNESDIADEFSGFVDLIEQDFRTHVSDLVQAQTELSNTITVEAVTVRMTHARTTPSFYRRSTASRTLVSHSLGSFLDFDCSTMTNFPT